MILLILILEFFAHGPSENGTGNSHGRRGGTTREQNKGDDGNECFHKWMGVGGTQQSRV
jgi:hypothetical protein